MGKLPKPDIDAPQAAWDAYLNQSVAQSDEEQAAREAEQAAREAEQARAKPTRDEIEFALGASGAGGAAGDYRSAILDPSTSPEKLKQKRSDYDRFRPEPALPMGGENADPFGLFGPNKASDARASDQVERNKREAQLAAEQKRLGFKTRDEMVDAIKSGKLVPKGTKARQPGNTAAGAALAGAAGAALSGADSAPAVASGGGGQARPVEPPIEARADINIASIKTPSEFYQELRVKMAHGEISPADAKKLSEDYRKWYASAAGLATRAEGLDVQQHTAEAEHAITQRNADADVAQRLTNLHEQAATRAATMEEAQQQAEEAYQRSLARHAAQYGELMDRIENDKIEPFSGKGGAAQQAGLITALIFGGISQALTGKPNEAIPIANRAMDIELQKQKFEADRRVTAAQGKMNLMQMTRSVFADERLAFLAAKQAMQEQLAAKVQIEIGRADTDKQRQDAAFAAESLARESEKTQDLFRARAEAISEQERLRAMMNAGAAIPGANDVDKMVRDGKGLYAFKQGEKTPLKSEGWSRLFKGYFFDPKAKDSAEKGLMMREQILGHLEKVRAMRAIPGSSTDPVLRARAMTLLTNIASIRSQSVGQGAQTNAEFDRNLDAIGDSKIDIWGTGMPKIDQTIDMLKSEARGYYAAAGVAPGAPPRVDPRTGEVFIPLYENPDAIARLKEGGKDVFVVEKPTGAAPGAGARHSDVEVTPGPPAAEPQEWEFR